MAGIAARGGAVIWEFDAVEVPPTASTGLTQTAIARGVARAVLYGGFSAVAGAGVSGTLARTNANDTSSAAGTTTVTGALARTNAADTAEASGSPVVAGALERTNAADTSAASGTTAIVGTVAATNAADTLAASGEVGAGGSVSGSLATTNAADTSAATGKTTIVGASATTNGADQIIAAGWAGLVSGSLARTNADDTVSASGEAAGVAANDRRYTGAGPRPTAARVNGKLVIGTRQQIEELLARLAQEHAEEDEERVEQGQAPKKRVVRLVSAKKAEVVTAPKAAETRVEVPAEAAVDDGEAQAIYAQAYATYVRRVEIQRDDEEISGLVESLRKRRLEALRPLLAMIEELR